MGSPDTNLRVQTISQVIDADGCAYRATHANNIWEFDDAVFAQKTEGNAIRAFTTGEDYFADFVAECEAATDEICIVGWQINWDAQLERGLRLYDVIRNAAGTGVSIYVMPWCHSNPVQTYDAQTATVLEVINDELREIWKKKGLKAEDFKKKVFIVNAKSMATENDQFFSHHQKQVIIDRKIAYVGGIDLCYGRYDDATYDLCADGKGRQVMNRYNSCIRAREALPEGASQVADPDRLTGAVDRYVRIPRSQTNRENTQLKIDGGAWQMPYRDAGPLDAILNKPALDSNTPDPFMLDAKCQPRMPWQDVHCRIEGPAVSDLLRNFVARWNSSGGTLLKFPAPPPAYKKKGEAHIQVLRSASAKMVTAESKVKSNPRKDDHGTEAHIHLAMIRLIMNARSFIYIESQFFVSAFGTESIPKKARLSPAAQFINGYDGGDQNATARLVSLGDDNFRLFSKHKKDLVTPPENCVCQALVARIRQAILEDRRPFHVYITLPVHPEGSLAKASIAVQVYWTMQTIAHGSHSLLNGIRRAFKAKALLDDKTAGSVKEAIALADQIPLDQLDQDDERWRDYVTLLNLRNWTTLDSTEHGKRFVTEQIYVHSKLMIVDDLYALLGSANINDRSLLGERDSELAVLVMDGENTLANVCGPGPKKPVRVFAHDLRKAIWAKLFGITGKVRPAEHLQAAIDAPGSPESWKAIQVQADKNAAAYEAAFPFVPRNWSGDLTPDNRPIPARILPSWRKGGLASPMPFEPKFWDTPQADPYGVQKLAAIQGFITALPTYWLQGENVRFEFPGALVVRNEQQLAPRAEKTAELAHMPAVGGREQA